MLKRTILATAAALSVLTAGPALWSGSSGELGAAEASTKLNYYREEGGEPYCKNRCDGVACCTVSVE